MMQTEPEVKVSSHVAPSAALEWVESFPFENPRAVDRLAASLFVNSRNPRGRMMAMFTAYFDASGNAKDQPLTIVSGYIANYLQWQRFEEEWAAAHKGFEVELPFHMADFAAACSRDGYRLQRNARADYVEIAKSPERANEFLKRLGLIQLSFVYCGVSCIVPMDVYEGVSSLLELRDVLPPYALAARMCLERVRQWEEKFGIRPPVECIFESGDFEQGKFTELMVDEGQDAPIYKKKADFAGLQGADQYAWEQFHFLKGYRQGIERDARKTFYFLLEAIPKLHTHASREFLIRLCERKGIDPRSGIKK